MDALNVELGWIVGLMEKHKVDPANLKPFLTAYARSVETAMGQSGHEITAWLMNKAAI